MKELSLKYFELAQEFNHKHEKRLREAKLHFRGNFGSCSLISLDKKTPEEGLGGLKSRVDIVDALIELPGILHKKVTIKDQEGSRPTPEKELQSWIILKAIDNDGWLPFEECAGKIRFVTSELVLPLDDKICNEVNAALGIDVEEIFKQRDIRNDVLGIDEGGHLIVIELKSKRNQTELCKQVDIFSYLLSLNAYRSAISKISKISTGREWLPGKIKKMIVWPSASNSLSRTLKIFNDRQITAIGYKAVNGSDGGAPMYSSDGQIEFSLETKNI